MDDPPLLDAFIRFCLDLNPKRVVLTHLEEFGRDADDYWDGEHVRKMSSKFVEKRSDISISYSLIGDQVAL